MTSTSYRDLHDIQTLATGSVPSAAWFETTRDNLERVARPPGARVERVTTPQVVPTGTVTAVQFTVEVRDTDGFANLGSAADRLTIPVGQGGLYQINARVTFAGSLAGSRRSCYITLNGATLQVIGEGPPPSSFGAFNGGDEAFLAAGDYVGLSAIHDAGVNMDIYATLSIRWVGVA